MEGEERVCRVSTFYLTVYRNRGELIITASSSSSFASLRQIECSFRV